MEQSIQSLQRSASYLLATLKDNPEIEGALSISINFSGYYSLMATVSDLMKLCTLAFLADEPYISPLVGSPGIDLAGILELALQLMPRAEAEFLDEAREVFKDTIIAEMPEGNYSTVTVWKPAGN